MTQRFVAILAGGSGTRLWPLSRSSHPKQLLDLVGGGSLLRNTFERVRPLVTADHVYVLTERSHVDGILEQLPEVPRQNVLAEPARRGTAACLALAARLIHQRAPDSVWASLHSDAFIQDDAAFRANLEAAFLGAADLPYLFTMGIPPSFPSTQFGYIQAGEVLREVNALPVHRVERFVEKPDSERAKEYLAAGRYYWNPGVFVWSAAEIARQFAELLPSIYEPLAPVAQAFGTPSFPAVYGRVYPDLPMDTIDTGIMERAPRVAMMPATFGWSDIGSWKELFEALPHDVDGNVSRGYHLSLDTRNSLIFGGRRLIATLGLEDIVIVETEDALLVCRRDRAAEVKRLVERLEQQGRRELL